MHNTHNTPSLILQNVQVQNAPDLDILEPGRVYPN